MTIGRMPDAQSDSSADLLERRRLLLVQREVNELYGSGLAIGCRTVEI